MINSETYSQEKGFDSTIFLKFSSQILTYLRELEAKIEFQEAILLELRKSQLVQDSSKKVEPIRGIHGLAQFLGISAVTCQKLKNSGKIPFVQFGRVVLFDQQKVMDALEISKKVK